MGLLGMAAAYSLASSDKDISDSEMPGANSGPLANSFHCLSLLGSLGAIGSIFGIMAGAAVAVTTGGLGLIAASLCGLAGSSVIALASYFIAAGIDFAEGKAYFGGEPIPEGSAPAPNSMRKYTAIASTAAMLTIPAFVVGGCIFGLAGLSGTIIMGGLTAFGATMGCTAAVSHVIGMYSNSRSPDLSAQSGLKDKDNKKDTIRPTTQRQAVIAALEETMQPYTGELQSSAANLVKALETLDGLPRPGEDGAQSRVTNLFNAINTNLIKGMVNKFKEAGGQESSPKGVVLMTRAFEQATKVVQQEVASIRDALTDEVDTAAKVFGDAMKLYEEDPILKAVRNQRLQAEARVLAPA